MAKGPSYTKQLIGSLLAAVIIALIVIALVTAKIAQAWMRPNYASGNGSSRN